MKSTWPTIIVIVVIAIVGFGGYKYYHQMNSTKTQQTMTHTTMMQAKPTAMMAKNSVYMMMPTKSMGSILTDPKRMTLYTYKKDTSGVSNCSDACLKTWPVFVASSAAGSFPANISVIKRTDGTPQYAWKGMPLYYFDKDTKAGDVNGEGIGGVWDVVK